MVAVKDILAVLAFNALAISAAAIDLNEVGNSNEVGLVNKDRFVDEASLNLDDPDPTATVRIKLATRKHWEGTVETIEVPVNRCYNLNDFWNDNTSGIGNVDRSDYKCTWFIHSNCDGDRYTNQWDEDLTDGGGKFNKSISSLSCKPK